LSARRAVISQRIIDLLSQGKKGYESPGLKQTKSSRDLARTPLAVAPEDRGLTPSSVIKRPHSPAKRKQDSGDFSKEDSAGGTSLSSPPPKKWGRPKKDKVAPPKKGEKRIRGSGSFQPLRWSQRLQKRQFLRLKC
jgi:hypothetical protein